MSQTKARDRVLVVFPGALGDFVCFLPAFREIRNAGSVTLLCKAELGGLACLAGASEVMTLEGRAASWLFSPNPPPEADDLFRGFDAIHSFTGSGVAEVERNLARWVGRKGIVSPFRSVDRVHAAVHFLRCVGLEVASLPGVALAISLELREGARARHLSAVNNRPLLLVHPGSGGKTKRWSSAGFRAVIEAWQHEVGHAAVVLGPAESAEIERWQSGGTATITPGNLIELAAILAEGDAYLGNDSGPTHLAAAVSAPGVALFGASDLEQWRPLGGTIEPLSVTPWTSYEEDSSPDAISLVWQALTRVMRAALP